MQSCLNNIAVTLFMNCWLIWPFRLISVVYSVMTTFLLSSSVAQWVGQGSMYVYMYM